MKGIRGKGKKESASAFFISSAGGEGEGSGEESKQTTKEGGGKKKKKEKKRRGDRSEQLPSNSAETQRRRAEEREGTVNLFKDSATEKGKKGEARKKTEILFGGEGKKEKSGLTVVHVRSTGRKKVKKKGGFREGGTRTEGGRGKKEGKRERKEGSLHGRSLAYS